MRWGALLPPGWLQARTWLRASAYGCYELLAVIRDAEMDAQAAASRQLDSPLAAAAGGLVSGDAAQEQQPAEAAAAAAATVAAAAAVAATAAEEDSPAAALVPLIQVFAPAADTHLYLTLEWLSRSGKKHGSNTPATDVPARACLAAHLIRLGKVRECMR